MIVGGGFPEKGTHNVIEPLSLGKSVITGPHIWTIECPAVEVEAAGVLTVVRRKSVSADAVRLAKASDGPIAGSLDFANDRASSRILDASAPVLEARA